MNIFIYGKDTFRSQKYLRENIERFVSTRDPQRLNTVVLDCANKNKIDFMGTILAQPFLAEKRMVVLKNLLICKNDVLQTDLLERIKEKKLPEATVMMFWESTDNFKSKLSKSLFEVLKKEKFCNKFDELKGVHLNKWIKDEIETRGGSIDNQAVLYLASESKGDSWYLNSLVDQLVAYCEGAEITIRDVQLFLDERADDNIFSLVESIVGRREKQVYKMIQEQYKVGEDVQFIFAMLLRQFRIMLQIRDLFERSADTNSNELAKKLNLHPFVVKKTLPLIRHYNMEKLRQAYQDLLDLDIKIKTGRGNNKMLLDLFVAKVCK